RSADFREEGTGIYDRVYSAERPELFFKATAWRCVAPGEPIGRRRDSGFTAAEPEIAIVLGRRGTILGFTLANDVSAWDIERDNPLYLPQSKVYTGCFAFGPAIVTPDEIADCVFDSFEGCFPGDYLIDEPGDVEGPQEDVALKRTADQDVAPPGWAHDQDR
ncbi:MAG: hypothetical protein HGB19_01685, partial [Chlorobiales bacterium]|nr:hypothetical protein [Chlorobiales bacterium]